MIRPFSFAPTPNLLFGEGRLSTVGESVLTFGRKVLLVTGARSFLASSQGQRLLEDWDHLKISYRQYAVANEPSPQTIDTAVEKHSDFGPDVVVAVGGGSVLDGGKAISAMLPLRKPVKNYLEGVGTSTHPGTKLPFIAVPTTAGTGSEATKNAVISEVGPAGYKRSLRHNRFIPDVAVIDPLLTIGCPKEMTAASGMDAFTQLLESFLSTTSNPMTDALAFEGLRRVSRSLMTAYRDGTNLAARTDMALASYLSGLTLANAGLGLVHGLASPVGGYFEVPHGVACSKLMSPSNRISVRKLRHAHANPEALRKYAMVGALFLEEEDDKTDDYKIDYLLDVIESWTAEMRIPPLRNFGITPADVARVAASADAKNNPINISKEEMIEVLQDAL